MRPTSNPSQGIFARFAIKCLLFATSCWSIFTKYLIYLTLVKLTIRRGFRLGSRRWSRMIAFGLLAAQIVLLLGNLRNTFITVDEAMNVAAGVSYWQTGRFFISRINPPLTKMLAVLPALAAKPNTDWSSLKDVTTERAEFRAGMDFTKLNQSRIFDLICLSRLVGLAWSALGGWLIYRWSSELFGRSAGCLSLALWCFEPYILGHSALVTSDIPATTAGLAASFAFVRYLKQPSCIRAAFAGGMLGVAESCKFTLLILYILWPILCLTLRQTERRLVGNLRWMRSTSSLGHYCLMVLVSLYVVGFTYGFQGIGTRLEDHLFVSQLLRGNQTESSGNRFQGSWLGIVRVPLPDDFLLGIDVQRVDFEKHLPSYLAGEWRSQGWWYYYLYALAVKLPLGTSVILAWGLLSSLRRHDNSEHLADLLVLIMTPLAIIALVSSQIGYTQHSRYVVPALPYLMINAGRLVSDHTVPSCIFSRRVDKILTPLIVWCLITGTIISSLRVYPHSLSYFNEAAGGPMNGHKHLVDSNIDWGQDFIRLKRWVDAHSEARPFRMAYYNFTISPEIAGPEFEIPSPGSRFLPITKNDHMKNVILPPGYYAISVNMLRGVAFPIPSGHGGYTYINLEVFRTQKPIARAGYSIYIYHTHKALSARVVR